VELSRNSGGDLSWGMLRKSHEVRAAMIDGQACLPEDWSRSISTSESCELTAGDFRGSRREREREHPSILWPESVTSWCWIRDRNGWRVMCYMGVTYLTSPHCLYQFSNCRWGVCEGNSIKPPCVWWEGRRLSALMTSSALLSN